MPDTGEPIPQGQAPAAPAGEVGVPPAPAVPPSGEAPPASTGGVKPEDFAHLFGGVVPGSKRDELGSHAENVGEMNYMVDQGAVDQFLRRPGATPASGEGAATIAQPGPAEAATVEGTNAVGLDTLAPADTTASAPPIAGTSERANVGQAGGVEPPSGLTGISNENTSASAVGPGVLPDAHPSETPSVAAVPEPPSSTEPVIPPTGQTGGSVDATVDAMVQRNQTREGGSSSVLARPAAAPAEDEHKALENYVNQFPPAPGPDQSPTAPLSVNGGDPTGGSIGGVGNEVGGNSARGVAPLADSQPGGDARVEDATSTGGSIGAPDATPAVGGGDAASTEADQTGAGLAGGVSPDVPTAPTQNRGGLLSWIPGFKK